MVSAYACSYLFPKSRYPTHTFYLDSLIVSTMETDSASGVIQSVLQHRIPSTSTRARDPGHGGPKAAMAGFQVTLQGLYFVRGFQKRPENYDVTNCVAPRYVKISLPMHTRGASPRATCRTAAPVPHWRAAATPLNIKWPYDGRLNARPDGRMAPYESDVTCMIHKKTRVHYII